MDELALLYILGVGTPKAYKAGFQWFQTWRIPAT